jgi:outer membrane usher protein FimD/PapC
MKKLLYSILFVAVSLSTFQSCDKDDDNNDGGVNLNNQISIAGTISNLSGVASLESYGENTDGSFDWDVTLVGTSSENISVYFDLNTNSENGLVAGTYTYSDIREAFSFVDIYVTTGNNQNYVPIEGSVVISGSGDNTSIVFNLSTQDDIAITGQWTGSFVVSNGND